MFLQLEILLFLSHHIKSCNFFSIYVYCDFLLNIAAMDKKDGNEDEKLKIVNRKRKYSVSKKLICSSVPYFEKMFCCDLLESKRSKVELDFDEHVFDSILDWIHSESFFMRMDFVISFYDAADYLMINERLLKPCLTYFHENFTIEHLPVVLPQVTKVSKILNSGSLNNIICRHFLLIANTDIFLDYPVETVEAILKLDLMIYSEYQVFESIMKWVDKDADWRKFLLPQLLNCVRWSLMNSFEVNKIKDNELIKALPNFDEMKTSDVEAGFNRSKQNLFVSIFQRDDSIIRIKAFDNDFFCFTIGDFIQDDSMSLEFVHGENISDILFDYGTKGVRIDWIKKTFRLLDFEVAVKTYYSRFAKFIVEFPSDSSPFSCYLEDKYAKLPEHVPDEESLILESNGKFIVIGKTKDEEWFGLFPVTHESWLDFYDDSFKATVLDNVIYVLTEDLEFIQFNYTTKCFIKSEPFKKEEFDFDDLILTSHQSNDDRLILVDKSTRKVLVFCTYEEEWSEKCCIMNVNFCSNSSGSSVNKLVAFTSTCLPMPVIEPLYKHIDD
ncbi:uncharacterized protein LOC112538718 [Tetranychus urticae]|uniref:uncharacterized protein LOC112538718 n=1 Tax=Tetranychus urticae TaxID=32264 RepID=UPI000D6587BE|nr:uncharacterized protein LOC112538718 [Tetranychus urticae]